MIRITTITLTSNFAITIARFHPSKEPIFLEQKKTNNFPLHSISGRLTGKAMPASKEKSRSVPAFGANFPEALFLPGTIPRHLRPVIIKPVGQIFEISDSKPTQVRSHSLGEGKWGRKSAGVSQSVRETDRDKSQSVPSPQKRFETKDLELPSFEGSLPSCSPHSAGNTRTSVHPCFSG